MISNYMTLKKIVESSILSGITVRIYNKRRAKKWYRSKEYVREKARERAARLKAEKEKEKEETKNEYTETDE